MKYLTNPIPFVLSLLFMTLTLLVACAVTMAQIIGKDLLEEGNRDYPSTLTKKGGQHNEHLSTRKQP